METFNGKEYLAIDIANNFGLDKESWKDRINWVVSNYNDLESFTDQADDKFLFIKGVKALRATDKGEPTGFIMGLDATASGYQVMAALSGCKKTGEAVNLVYRGKRADIYRDVANYMNSNYGTNVDRSMVKKPIMTTAYGSQRQPEEVFGEDTPELKAFYDTLVERLGGAMDVMDILRETWDDTAFKHQFTMPDGHKVILPTTEMVDVKIQADEVEHTFTYRMRFNQPNKNGTNIIANVVHAFDGYIAREMVRKAHKQGFQLAHIHDSFWAHPNYMNLVRLNYTEILADISRNNYLGDVFKELTGKDLPKEDEGLTEEILRSEYALS